MPGYSVAMKNESLQDYEYPKGPAWRKLYAEGKFQDPDQIKCPLIAPRIEDHEE